MLILPYSVMFILRCSPRCSYQLSHFCPPMATSRLKSSSRRYIAVNVHLCPSLSMISRPSAICRSIAQPTTSFAFQPRPPIFLNSLMSAIAMEKIGSGLFVADVVVNETQGIVAVVLIYTVPFLPLYLALKSIGPVTGVDFGSGRIPSRFLACSDPIWAFSRSVPKTPSTPAFVAPLKKLTIRFPVCLGLFFLSASSPGWSDPGSGYTAASTSA